MKAFRGIQLLLAMLQADVYGSGAFGPHVARAARLLAAAGRVALWAVGMGGLGAVVGSLGPRWLPPGTTQAPGAVVAGVVGALGGLACGLWRERGRGTK
jgi:hypothetical protein